MDRETNAADGGGSLTWADVGRDVHAKVRTLALLVWHLLTDVSAFGAFWAALFAVQAIEARWPLHGWAGTWLGNVHQAGVFSCGTWTTFTMLAHCMRMLSGRSEPAHSGKGQ
jgi:hypothetical protein